MKILQFADIPNFNYTRIVFLTSYLISSAITAAQMLSGSGGFPCRHCEIVNFDGTILVRIASFLRGVDSVKTKTILRKIAPALLAFFVVIHAGEMKADALEPAKGTPILRVSGLITNFNAGDDTQKWAEFDLQMLAGMEKTSFATNTPWFGKPVTFEGVTLRHLMSVVGATGDEIVAIAINDYRSTLPMADFEEFDVILAYKRDGAFMSVRDKGPLFIVYPYDRDPDLHRQKYYSRSVWQVAEFIVR